MAMHIWAGSGAAGYGYTVGTTQLSVDFMPEIDGTRGVGPICAGKM